jgi:hypothetical protein
MEICDLRFCEESDIPQKVDPSTYIAMPNMIEVWCSNQFLIQIYKDNNYIRLTISRISKKLDGGWEDGITWDELFKIKNEIGFADQDCVELYPCECDVVNIANMRHLWVMPKKVDFAWRKNK